MAQKLVPTVVDAVKSGLLDAREAVSTGLGEVHDIIKPEILLPRIDGADIVDAVKKV